MQMLEMNEAPKMLVRWDYRNCVSRSVRERVKSIAKRASRGTQELNRVYANGQRPYEKVDALVCAWAQNLRGKAESISLWQEGLKKRRLFEIIDGLYHFVAINLRKYFIIKTGDLCANIFLGSLLRRIVQKRKIGCVNNREE